VPMVAAGLALVVGHLLLRRGRYPRLTR
jgi:hypothetical protein